MAYCSWQEQTLPRPAGQPIVKNANRSEQSPIDSHPVCFYLFVIELKGVIIKIASLHIVYAVGCVTAGSIRLRGHIIIYQ